MSTERIDPQFHEAVVTYSRVEPREQGFVEDLVPAGRREPTIDATEIHVLDGRDDADLGFAVRSERRADEPLAAAADLGLDEKRSPVSRIVFATAALSIVAGVGVLAATVGIATITPSRTPAETVSSAPPALAVVDPAETTASSGIRAIPLATGKDAETASIAPKEVEPPLPRARPEEASVTTVSTKSEPAPAKAELRPSTDPVKPEVATLPPPVKSVPTLPPPAPAAPPVAQVTPASAEAGNTDALISSIEETLAKRDASSPLPPGSLDPHGMEVLPEGEGPVAVLPPPASMAPNYPSSQGPYVPSPAMAGPAYPAAGPTYDVLPPAPVTGNGYGSTYPADAYPPPAYPAEATPTGPVPPADVPYSYPSRPMEYEVIPEKRPGLLRRTWMRTADAVTRVFTRDEDDVEPPPQY